MGQLAGRTGPAGPGLDPCRPDPGLGRRSGWYLKNLSGARGFVVIEYAPVASHGDPIRPQTYQISTLSNAHPFTFLNVFLNK